MLVPSAVLKLAGGLHQDVGLLVATVEGLADHCTASLTSMEKTEARLFLTQLLDGTHNTAQIISVWNALPKDIRIDDHRQIVMLLELIRDRLPSQ